ncbi:MAG TPA: hypothetical protein DDX98_14045 [Bacteroidales bacterium]|jgi:hypothetical protein|nr:hypothetical protein [Bacteroidales bacterium]
MIQVINIICIYTQNVLIKYQIMKKTLKFSFVLFAVLSFALTSCSKDEDGSALPYVGTWVEETTDDFGFGPMTIRNTLTLNENTFEMIGSMIMEGIEMDMFGMRGNLAVSETEFTISPTSLGEADEMGNMTWINKGDEDWDAALRMMEMSENETAAYSIEGNTLTITMDGEQQVFNKK